ncbi:MAG: Cytochrome c nitrite reductase, small subunit NrfH [Candidatus Kapaibacterium sp.]|nr:MAG: Cytochrome c nitrite reductase, small subunit NrfH [Candidatus Kapabacteria bacterium]
MKVYFSILGGIFVGLSLFGIYVSNVTSYLSDDPKACVNCHVMTPFFATWSHSSHRERATCNDCHVPHDNKIRSLWFKMNDGIRHSTIFTLGTYPQVIRIRKAGTNVVQENCVRCHSHQISALGFISENDKIHSNISSRLCWDCHREVPHGRISSQASTPYARVPVNKEIVPQWLKKQLNMSN